MSNSWAVSQTGANNNQMNMTLNAHFAIYVQQIPEIYLHSDYYRYMILKVW